jgi:hypothetical protein
MAIRTQLSLRLPNSPGALAGVCRLLSDQRVSIIAMMLDDGGHLRLIVDNQILAAGLLREHHHQVTTKDVLAVRVSNYPGAFAPVVKLVADAGFNVEYAYGSTSEDTTGAPGAVGAVVVLGVDDAMRAAAATGV